MRRLFTALAVLILSVLIAVYLSREAGYLLVALGPWRVEMSLVVFVALLALVALVLYVVISALMRAVAVPGKVRRWQHKRRMARVRSDLTDGLLLLVEGDYEASQRRLTRRIERSDAPLVNYLAAAIAAQRHGDRENRDRYLTAAERSARRARPAVRLLQAQLQTEAGQWEEAQASLNDLLERQPDHRRVLELMADCCEALGDWERVEELLPRLRRQQIVPQERLQRLSRWSARERLTRAAAEGPAALENAWKDLHRPTRHDPDVLSVYLDGLLVHGLYRAAEALLRKQLQKEWDEALLRRYLTLPAESQIMHRIEQWLKERPEDPMLLYVAGVTALRQQLWGRAREYLEAAVARSARPEYFRALGALQEQLGEHEAARESYRRALDLQGTGDAVLGLPPAELRPDEPYEAAPEPARAEEDEEPPAGRSGS